MRRAAMPMTVAMQAPSEVAHRSVGEKSRPSPPLSLGAMVSMTEPESSCSMRTVVLPVVLPTDVTFEGGFHQIV